MRRSHSAVAALAMAVMLAAAYGDGLAAEKEVETTSCKTAKDGTTICFDYCLLKADKTILQPVPEVDTCVDIHKLKLGQRGTSRDDMLKLVSDACSSQGGAFHQVGDMLACARASAPARAGAATVSARVTAGDGSKPLWANGGGTRPLQVAVTETVAREIAALLERQSFSKEAASVLVRIAAEEGGASANEYHQSGGWCWNDDWTFYGNLPCPKKLKDVRDDVRAGGKR